MSRSNVLPIQQQCSPNIAWYQGKKAKGKKSLWKYKARQEKKSIEGSKEGKKTFSILMNDSHAEWY